MYLLILSFPLLGAVMVGLLGFYFGRSISIKISIFCMFVSAIISLFLYYEVCLSETIVVIKLFTWLKIDIINITFGLLFDNLTCIMLLIICWISFFVHLYSIEYLSKDPFLCRFMSYLSLFTFFMEILVTADNLIQMFIGWEGVGLCSYLLINFWHTRVLANKAALKAMIMNRITDIFFFIGIILMIWKLKTAEYLIIFDLIPFIENDIYVLFGYHLKFIEIIGMLFLIGAVGKSAQLGMHTWLPDAMEGPTPVSALLHAATMVTAGVFLILRCSAIFECSETILGIMALWGGLTAFFCAFISVFQEDIKKIIAYSTCSQLGYMFFACGVSNYSGALFHLFNHAFFKALLFLGAGAIIHALSNEQDMRQMGKLIKVMPITYICMLIGFLAISGFPFFAGFYSKEFILEFTLSRFIISDHLIFFLGLGTAFFTSAYCGKIIYIVFLNLDLNNYNNRVLKAHEAGINMLIPIISLAFLSLISGYFMSDVMIGPGSFFWGLNFYVNWNDHFELEEISFFLKSLPLIVAFYGYYISIWFLDILKNYKNLKYYSRAGRRIEEIDGTLFYQSFIKFWWYVSYIPYFFFNGAFFNFIYNEIFLFVFKSSYKVNVKWLDKGYLEYLGPYGIYKVMRKFIINFNTFTSIFFNFLLIFLFFLFFLFIYIFPIYSWHISLIIIGIIICFYEFA